VVVRLAGQECRFALEYERTPKAARQYLRVQQRTEQETSIAHFLYLTANVKRNGSPVSMTLASVLTDGKAVQKAGSLWKSIAM